ncbi:MAG: hypothetical protein E7Z77_01825 [Methanobrevibacter sp.]|uniref:hypothetical protein n=1 Tax=Methanobrevibacter sp. TaxID=66852 RepID=UPI0025FE9DFE|nr:hypothetical protein [Methanobrevibacter sp.]MBE6508130.1 hypothetical protein [Methanobrevibacter sp.]
MDGEGNIIIPIIGYVVALLSPILGLVYGTILFFFKKDVELYRKHGRFIIYFAIAVFIASLIVAFAMGLFK